MMEAYGYPPFAWQQRLLASVVSEGRWPELVAAPTGAGKSTVIDVHAFANALAEQDQLILPRRMVMTVNRRNLIDDHAAHAEQLARLLNEASEDSVLSTVRSLLERRSGRTAVLQVSVIRGGIPLTYDWRSNPLATAVIAATPDMWGSRVLFRGYGTSRTSRSLEAGLLSRDCVLVVDESHLNRQLITTARRLSELDSAASEGIDVPALQVVETTATPPEQAEGYTIIQLTGSDLADSPALSARMRTPKPVSLMPVTLKRDRVNQLADEFAEQAWAMRSRHEAVKRPIGIIVNTVDLAAEISGRLRKRLAAEPDNEAPGGVETMLGAQRLFDRQLLKRAAELFDPRMDSNVKFIVATQTLEVGVDMDLAGLVTELAPASAIVQRSGRVNRIGSRADAEVLVIQPQYDKARTRTPYSHDDLETAAAWLTSRSQEPEGLAPWALLDDLPPSAEPRRLLWQRPEWNDAIYWSRTSEDLAAADRLLFPGGEDLSLWLRDDFSPDVEASLMVRELLTGDFLQDSLILQHTPPLSEELYPVPLYRLRDLAEKLWQERKGIPLVIIRDGRPLQVVDREVAIALREENLNRQTLNLGEIRPGDTLVVTPEDKVFLAGLIPHPKGTDVGTDVYEAVIGLNQPRVIHKRALLNPASAGADEDGTAYDAALRYIEAAQDPEESEVATNGLIEALTPGAMNSEGANTLLEEIRVTVLPPVSEGAPVFVLLSTLHQDDLHAQTTSRNLVQLDRHQSMVADRANQLGKQVGLSRHVQPLTIAGLNHDQGKRETRFQTYLRGRISSTALLAKSRAAFNVRRWIAAGLSGWRHEQLSAAWVWSSEDPEIRAERELITWLVGTSHGRGRTTFNQDASTLLPEPAEIPVSVQAAATELFTEGAWDDLFEPLTRRLGPWGLAYLEALLRTADQQISAEGN